VSSGEPIKLLESGLLPCGKLKRVVGSLSAGGCIILPTDTGYLLGVDARNRDAVERLFMIKGREPSNPIHVAVAGLTQAEPLVAVSVKARLVMEAFMPGPITIVLPDRGELPGRLAAGTGHLGIRIPDCAAVLQVCAELGGPITATSANPAGKPPSDRIEELMDIFADSVDCFVAVEKFRYSQPSTVIRVSGEAVEILRQGPVSSEEILAVTG